MAMKMKFTAASIKFEKTSWVEWVSEGKKQYAFRLHIQISI